MAETIVRYHIVCKSADGQVRRCIRSWWQNNGGLGFSTSIRSKSKDQLERIRRVAPKTRYKFIAEKVSIKREVLGW